MTTSIAVVGSLGALIGTTVGAFLTYRLQNRSQLHSRLHEARLDAYRQFIAANMAYRKTLISRWYALERHPTSNYSNSEVYEARAELWSAYYTVELLASDTAISDAALNAREITSSIKSAADSTEIEVYAESSRLATSEFAKRASRQISRVE